MRKIRLKLHKYYNPILRPDPAVSWRARANPVRVWWNDLVNTLNVIDREALKIDWTSFLPGMLDFETFVDEAAEDQTYTLPLTRT